MRLTGARSGSEGFGGRQRMLGRGRCLGFGRFVFHAQRAGWLDRIVGVKYSNAFGPNEEHKGDMRSLVNKA